MSKPRNGTRSNLREENDDSWNENEELHEQIKRLGAQNAAPTHALEENGEEIILSYLIYGGAGKN